MLLICDGCLRECTGVMKIPCGYYIEWGGKSVIFWRDDETYYHNFCLNCLEEIGEKELES